MDVYFIILTLQSKISISPYGSVGSVPGFLALDLSLTRFPGPCAFFCENSFSIKNLKLVMEGLKLYAGWDFLNDSCGERVTYLTYLTQVI